MQADFSSVVVAPRATHGRTFAAARIDMNRLAGFTSPLVGVDHFWMSGPTFAPHPHAGFAAITYLFDDSEGSLRNRDSLGHDFVAGPGDLVWTQAGTGVIHDELPESPGKTVHGLQIFVNSSATQKSLAPKVQHVRSAEVPVWKDSDGNALRVVVGEYGSVRSPMQPQEPFRLLEARVRTQVALELPSGWNAVIYVIEGSVSVQGAAQARTVPESHVLGVRGGVDHVITLSASEEARVVILSGPAINEPVVTYGPFVMADHKAISDAVERYAGGGMGSLEPLPG